MAGTGQPSHRTMVDAATSIMMKTYAQAVVKTHAEVETVKKQRRKGKEKDTPKIAIQVTTSLPYRLLLGKI